MRVTHKNQHKIPPTLGGIPLLPALTRRSRATCAIAQSVAHRLSMRDELGCFYVILR